MHIDITGHYSQLVSLLAQQYWSPLPFACNTQGFTKPLVQLQPTKTLYKCQPILYYYSMLDTCSLLLLYSRSTETLCNLFQGSVFNPG